LRRWIGDVAASNSRFWGRVPMTPVLLALMPEAGGRGIGGGRVMAAGGATIQLRIGNRARLPDLYEEWVLVHEFLHLGSPLVRDTGLWFNEGIATYFEPILRARAGWKREADVWLEWIDWMPRGVVALEPPGLARSRQAPYWGGALFLLLADIALRGEGDGRRGIEDCLRSLLAEGGNASARASTQGIIAACEAATGNSGTLAALAERYLYRGETVDLDRLWASLGVVRTGDGQIRFDDKAPLAPIRRLIVPGGPNRLWEPIGSYRASQDVIP